MPRRSVISASERDRLLVMPNTEDELIRHYTFNDSELSIIFQHRGAENRLGFAVQLCHMRYPGMIIPPDVEPFAPLLRIVAKQLKVKMDAWEKYGRRAETRRDHLIELQSVFGFDSLRHQHIIIPAIDVIDRICSEAITRSNQRSYRALTEQLSDEHRQRLDDLLQRKPESQITWLAWLRQSPAKPNSRQMLEHIERLKIFHAINLPAGIDRKIHQNRLLKIAREGGQMTPADLSRFELLRRYATLVALTLEGTATVTDEIIDLHDRIIGKLFNAAKNRHQQKFQESGKAINDKVRLYGKIGQALLAARQNGGDAFAAIESVMSWEAFTSSVTDAEKLAQPEDFDYLHRLGESYSMLRRYAPAFLLCALSELKNSLRSGDMWVEGSRQFKDFEEYLVPANTFNILRSAGTLPLDINIDCDQYLHDRLGLLEQQLTTVNSMALSNDLPDAVINESGLKITPHDTVVPAAAKVFIDQTAMCLPHIKITDLLMEVDAWTGFSRQFTHLKIGDIAKDTSLLLTAILADAINLGLTKMAECCPGTTYAKLSWLQAWHIRDETYSAALAELVNAQLQHPFAQNWGDGTTSSSDGQRFKAGNHGESTGHVNPKYGTEPGRMFYTHISDQYAPFNIKVINVGVRDSTYVLDGLLYHESDLRIDEHYTDTAGFTDHVFGSMHLLGFRFAPRIRDLKETKLYIPGKSADYPALEKLIGGKLNIKHLRSHWTDILRLTTSIKQGTVTASLMLRKLGSYPRQNGLSLALREFGRIERTLFILDWLQNVELRRRVHAGLNKGESRNSLARAVFFNRLGEIRDRSFEQQQYRASGLNLVTAAIALWNTVYLDRVIKSWKEQGRPVDQLLLQNLSPLGWEHINLTGDYVWRNRFKSKEGHFRAIRPLPFP